MKEPAEMVGQAAPTNEPIEFDKDIEGSEYQAPADLYRYTDTAKGIDGFEAVTGEHVDFFREQGYLVINHAFTRDEVRSALDGLLDLINGSNPEFKGVQFEGKARELLPTLSREQKQYYVRKLYYYVEFDARLKAISEHPQLLSTVTRMIGAEPTLFADQAMLKPPRIGREKPWHQDHAFFNLPMGTRVVGVWIALDEAVPENGCMHVIPGGHLKPIEHFQRRDWQICDTEVAREKILAVPLEPGSCLLFDGLIPHGTPESRSDKWRRALQLHYAPASVGKITKEERMAVFNGEAKGLTC